MTKTEWYFPCFEYVKRVYRSVIIEVLRNNANNKHLCISSVYDVLEEKFIENGEYKELPGNQQTLRNYVHYLQKNGIVESEPKNSRIYEYVFDTPPGEQMLIDFGQQKIGGVFFASSFWKKDVKFCLTFANVTCSG